MDISTPNIWQLQARRDIAGLIKALKHADAGIRKRAATALRTLDAAEAVPTLKQLLVTEEDWQAQASMTAAIQYLSRENRLESFIVEQDVDGLINMLYSPNEAEIMGAARALGKIGDTRAVETLITVFRKTELSDDVRYIVAESLLALKSAPSVVALMGGLQREEWQVRRNSAAVLGQLRATWAAPALANTLHDSHPVVRRTAEAALRRLNTPAARDYLANWQKEMIAHQQAAVAPPPAPAPVEAAPPVETPAKSAPESGPEPEPVPPAMSAPATETPAAVPTAEDTPPVAEADSAQPTEEAPAADDAPPTPVKIIPPPPAIVKRVLAAMEVEYDDTPTLPSRPTDPLRPSGATDRLSPVKGTPPDAKAGSIDAPEDGPPAADAVTTTPPQNNEDADSPSAPSPQTPETSPLESDPPASAG